MTSNHRLDSVLVVGGCGFLGHHIVSQLLDAGSERISVFDLRTTRNRLPGVNYYDCDITSHSGVQSVLETVKPTIIIHTASPVLGVGYEAIYQKVNVDGTRLLLECAGRLGCVKAFVYTSSASIVHDSYHDLVNADESWPVLQIPEQREIYSHTKGVAEKLVLAANRKYNGMMTTAVRPAGVFGEGDVQMLPPMLKVFYDGRTKFQLGSNQNYFDFTYVGNVAHAHILAAKALINSISSPPSENKRVDGEAFFVTNDEPMRFWDFPRALWAVAGDKTKLSEVWVIPTWLGLLFASIAEWIFWVMFLGKKEPVLTRKKVKYSAMTRTYRIDKIKQRLGYKPLVNMKDAIRRAVEYFMAENDKKKQ